jgi:outer membrane protein assembly factor BamB
VNLSAGTEKRVFFGGGKTLYALDAATGQERWHKVICGNPDGLGRTPPYDCETDDADRTRIFTSPAVFQNTVFVGASPDGQNGYHGRVLAFDADNGAELWSFEVDDTTMPGSAAKPGYTGGPIYRGCGGVWSSIAIDEVNSFLYFGVADCDFGSDPPYNNRVVRLTLGGQSPLAFEPGGPGSLDTEPDCDFDIGATPNLFEIGDVPIVGVGRKDGKYYQWNRLTGNCAPSPTSPDHCLVLDSGVPGGVAGGFIGSPAADIGPGRTGKILGATALGDTTGGCFADPALPVSPQDPSLHGMNADGTGGPNDPNPNWHRYLNQSFAGSAVANGVLYVGSLLMQDFRVFNAATGELLAIFPMGGQVNSAPAVAGGMVFVGSGSSFVPSPSGVNAFALPPVLP